MNPSKHGLSSAGKTGIVVVIVILVLGAAYLGPSMLKGGGTQSNSSSNLGGSGSNPGASQNIGLLSIFGYFPQMQLTVYSNDVPDAMVQSSSYTYSVLGKATLNSTKYTKVEFTTVGESNDVIAWFNATGGVNRVDVVGFRNYTGSGAYFLAQAYTLAYGLIPQISDNATLLSLLSKTSETTTSIGPTMMNVTTYSLAAPTGVYTSLTVKYATIPGTNVQLAVYVSEATTDGSTSTIQVTSLTK